MAKSVEQLTREIVAARQAQDWELHEQLWEERRVAEVEADEQVLRHPNGMLKVIPMTWEE